MSPGNLPKVILTTLFVALNVLAFAQVKTDVWHQGEVELIDNKVYKVNLRYVPTRSEGLLQAMENGELMTLSPLKVKSFEFFEESKNEYRYFISVPNFLENHQYQKRIFIEVLYAGSGISLLRHADSYGMMATETLYLMDHIKEEIFSYAVSKYSRKNRPVYINADTKLLFQLADKHKKELKDYVASHDLNLRKPRDIIALLTYHDQLSNISAQDNSAAY